jgi:hypothetical protein
MLSTGLLLSSLRKQGPIRRGSSSGTALNELRLVNESLRPRLRADDFKGLDAAN